MTLSTTANTKTYTGDNSTTEFAFPYLVYASTDLTITLDGVSTSAWALTDNNDLGLEAGVTVRFTTAPGTDVAIVIQRIVSYTQDTDFENFDGNPADVTEKQLDLLAMQTQQLAEKTDRTILSPIGTVLTSNTISGTIDSTSRVLTITTAGPATATITSFGDLSVVETSLASGDLLQYNGTNWVNTTTLTGDLTFSGVLDVTNINAATSAGGSLRTSGGASCISWGSGGSANSTLGGNMSGASSHKLVNMADPTSAQDYATKAYVDASAPSVALNGGHAANKYYGISGYTDTAGSTVFANNLYFHPIIVTAQTTFTRIGLNITTGAAGNGRFGIYSMSDGQPSALVADLGTISTASTGEVELTISQSLDAGTYCLAFVCSNNFSATQADIVDSGVASLVWGIDGFDVSAEANKQGPVAFTYGALPNPPTGLGNYTTNNGLLMWLRKV